jgi:valyl-tRNA synthetase
MIENRYVPGAVEGRIYAAWEAAGAFRAGRPERAKAEPYCIVIPPPNVTGSLHMGHALNNTLQDTLCRFERMRRPTGTGRAGFFFALAEADSWSYLSINNQGTP